MASNLYPSACTEVYTSRGLILTPRAFSAWTLFALFLGWSKRSLVSAHIILLRAHTQNPISLQKE